MLSLLSCIKGEPAIEEYYEMHTEAERLCNEIADSVVQSPAATQFLSPGRVVVVKSQSVSSFAFFPSIHVSLERKKRNNIISFLFSFPVHMFFWFSFSLHLSYLRGRGCSDCLLVSY